MVTTSAGVRTFDLSGGRLCLDFTNTVSDRGSEEPADLLRTYEDLLAWAQQASSTPPHVARGLLRRAAAHPAKARSTLTRAVALREALYRLFAAIAAGRKPRPGDLVAMNAEVPYAFARSRVAAAGGRFELKAEAADDDLASPLAPVVQSAVDLLTTGKADRVRVCAADTCAWLFIDTTKNRTRRWCDMTICGNREKARRFRQRES